MVLGALLAAKIEHRAECVLLESALERAYGLAQSQAKTAAEFEMNRVQYEQQLALLQARGGGGGGGSARPATSARTQTAQGTGDITQDAIADLKSVFTNANEANAAIKEQMAELAAAGVDIAALVDAANGLGGRRQGTSSY